MVRQEQYLLTIDAGTGSGRAVLFDLAGNQRAIASREWSLEADSRYPGALDFNTEKAWGLICEAVREALSAAQIDPGQVAAVTATSMREGMVLYDRAGEEIWACPNADTRAGKECAAMRESGLAAEIYQVGGDWVNVISPPRFWWLKENAPELLSGVRHMTMIADWVLYKLSGEFVTDPSVGSSSGIFDLTKRTWSQALIEAADLPRGIYPQVHECGEIIGKVSAAGAENTGLAEGTPVVTGGADTQAGLLGVGASEAGRYTILGGTFWQTALVTDFPLIDPQQRLRTLCHCIPGQWMIEGIGVFHGFSMRWFRDAFCQEEIRQAQDQGSDPYDLMELLAQKTPAGSNGIYAILSDVMDSKRWRHAPPAFIGFDILNPAASGKKECVRALEESAAYVTKAHYDTLVSLSKMDTDSIVFAGGASKGTLWTSIVASVLNRSLRIPVVRESTALGAALWAGVGVGVFPNISEAVAELVRFSHTVEPDGADAKAYEEHYDKWAEIYPHLKAVAEQNLLPPLWRTP